MKPLDLIAYNAHIHRILAISQGSALLIDCVTLTMPSWVDVTLIDGCVLVNEDDLDIVDFDSLSPHKRKLAHHRYNLIASILPVAGNKYMRSRLIASIAEANNISKQTIRKYLCLFLAYQNISCLAPCDYNTSKVLSGDEKNFRWAINKYYYSPLKHTLKATYLFMLKDKYTDEYGVLFDDYPPFHRFRYFYSKTKKLQKYYISREGLTSYKRNHRPLIGNGVREFASSIGTGMLDSTILDIYLINDAGQLIGRPILTACVDAYSGMCCGYSLTWEGGVYSLKMLFKNIISDKVGLCKSYGVTINKDDWNCDKLPATFVTDKGKEYTSYILEQITDLGISIINLPPYRPDLKSCVEQFFNVIQNLYKPHLKGRGVIESDYMERGAPDYRKTACLTMNELEKIILKCIIYYNTERVVESFSYTKEMIDSNIQPYANSIWNYSIAKIGANLIEVTPELLHLTLLPRAKAKFTPKGLVYGKLRYHAKGYTEQYLMGGDCEIAYDPECTSCVWLIDDNGEYIKFSLIEKQYDNQSFDSVNSFMREKTNYLKSHKNDNVQARVTLIDDIQTIANNCSYRPTDTSDVRKTRSKEKKKLRVGG